MSLSFPLDRRMHRVVGQSIQSSHRMVPGGNGERRKEENPLQKRKVLPNKGS